jgi:hypothetical protein
MRFFQLLKTTQNYQRKLRFEMAENSESIVDRWLLVGSASSFGGPPLAPHHSAIFYSIRKPDYLLQRQLNQTERIISTTAVIKMDLPNQYSIIKKLESERDDCLKGTTRGIYDQPRRFTLYLNKHILQ